MRKHETGRPYVLLVDDDEDSLTIFRQTLEWAQIPVKTAASGREALRLARTAPPVVTLADLHMPVMSGVDLLRALRADPRTRQVPAVALTGVPEMLDTVTDVRFDRVLTKPVPLDDLIRTVRTFLDIVAFGVES
jgi:CheY-like chemotaxis protein